MVLVSQVPFHVKRPDGIVYRCVEESRGKRKTKPTATGTLLVIEVVSPGTVTADLIDKRALYARLGIPQYWIVRMTNDDGPVRSIEMLRLTTDGTYITERVAVRAHSEALAVQASDPLEVSTGWDQLDLGLDLGGTVDVSHLRIEADLTSLGWRQADPATSSTESTRAGRRTPPGRPAAPRQSFWVDTPVVTAFVIAVTSASIHD